MAHKAISWVINDIEFPREVKPPARWLLVQIADRADKDSWSCFPSHKTLASDAGMSKRTVLDLLFVLEAAGLIERTPQFRANGERTTDMITLLRGDAIVAGGAPRDICPDQPQLSAPERANVAAHNLVTEPGNRTSVVLNAPDPFEEWWNIYPRKAAKVAARKAWAQMSKQISDLTLDELMVRTRVFADAVIQKDPEHIAHPATWLRGERWNDEPQAIGGQNARGTPASSPVPDRRVQQHQQRTDSMLSGAMEALNRRRRWGLGD